MFVISKGLAKCIMDGPRAVSKPHYQKVKFGELCALNMILFRTSP